MNHSFTKLSDYYTKIDESPYYAAAVALHPCQKFDYFECQWGSTTGGKRAITTAKKVVRLLFKQYLDRASSEAPPPLPLAEQSLFIDDDENSEDDDWIKAFGDHTATAIKNTTMQQHAIRQRQESELDRFMNDTLDTHYIDSDLT